MRSAIALFLMAAAAVVASAAPRGGFELLSNQEYQKELSARALPGAALIPRAADLNAPSITVVSPAGSGAIQPPVDIDVRFKPADGPELTHESTVTLDHSALKPATSEGDPAAGPAKGNVP